MNRPQRVVVTGLGAVSPFGWSLDDLRRGLAGARCAIAPAAHFDTTGQRTRVAGEVGAEPRELAGSFAGWARLSRSDRFAVCAASEACREAAYEARGTRTGVFFGSSTAGMAESEDFYARLLGLRPGPARARQLVSQQLNGPGDAVARELGTHGPVETVSSACASGTLAVGEALDALRGGEIDVALAGGADGLCLLTYSGFNALRLVDSRPSVPFRDDRQGMSLGEGAGVLLLETLEHARRRGARPLAELLGVGASCDAHHMTAPHPEGEGSARALRAALRDADVSADAVAFVNAHGTGTEQNDLAESRALGAVFGPRVTALPIVATKALVGHLLGSAGAIEAVDTVLCLVDRAVHAVPAERGAVDESCGVDLVLGGSRPLPEGSVAVSTSFAFGGANAAIVFAGWRDGDAA